jgi:hypothetical protein
MPTDAYKEAREEISTHLCTVQEVRVFCPKLSKGHEIGVYCVELKSKQQLMEWCHITSPRKEEFTERIELYGPLKEPSVMPWGHCRMLCACVCRERRATFTGRECMLLLQDGRRLLTNISQNKSSAVL